MHPADALRKARVLPLNDGPDNVIVRRTYFSVNDFKLGHYPLLDLLARLVVNLEEVMHIETHTSRTMKRMIRPTNYPLFSTALTIALSAFTAVAGNAPSIPTNVNFNEHVAPILFQNCARCHRPGEAAPFSLLNYEDAKKRARLIAEVTESRLCRPGTRATATLSSATNDASRMNKSHCWA